MRTMRAFDMSAADQCPQHPHDDGLRLEPVESSAYSDAMPQAVRVTDADGRSYLYVRPRRLAAEPRQDTLADRAADAARNLVKAIMAPRVEDEVTIRKSVAAEFRRQAVLPGHEGVKERLLQMAAMTEPG